MTTAPQEPQTDPAGVSRPGFGWVRATATTAVIVVIGGALLLYTPDLVLTRLTGISRSARVAVATGGFLVALAVLAWALRRLQARRLI